MKTSINGFKEWMVQFLSKKNSIEGMGREELLQCNLFEKGLIDSMGVMTLVMELESEYNIMFTPEDFQDRRFTSIIGLNELILEKKSDT